MKSIFTALLVSERHGEFMKEYLDMIDSFTYPDIKLSISENTPDDGTYFKKLKKMCSKYDFVENVMRFKKENGISGKE